MAELNNGRSGAGYLAARIDVLRKEPTHGIISRNHVEMNSDVGLLWVEVSFWVGDRGIYSQEVMIHSLDIDQLAEEFEQMLQGTCPLQHATHYGYEQVIQFGLTSPELRMIIRHPVFNEWPEEVKDLLGENEEEDEFFEVMIGTDPGIAAGESRVTGEGPMMYFEPRQAQLYQFIKDFRSEKEVALLLG